MLMQCSRKPAFNSSITKDKGKKIHYFINFSGFASASAKTDQNLERSLKRLDQDVRRAGRITRRDIEEILEEIRHQRSATSSQSLLVIRCCGKFLSLLIVIEIVKYYTLNSIYFCRKFGARRIARSSNHFGKRNLENIKQIKCTDGHISL